MRALAPHHVCVAVIGVLVAASSAPVHASFTGPVTSSPGYDPIKGVLDRVYFAGASVFVPSMPENAAPQYSGGGLTATRVDDFGLGGVLDAATGSPGSTDDQLWSGVTLTVRFAEKHAAFLHELGYDMGAQGGFVKLVEDYRPPLSVNVTFNPGDVWAWSLYSWGGNTPYTWSSKQSLNSDGADHMLTYRIAGLPSGYPTWLLLWDDIPAAGSDLDFDDTVFEITAIPEPATVCLLGAAMLLAARCSARRSRGHGFSPDR
jgi:hypothetical protein